MSRDEENDALLGMDGSEAGEPSGASPESGEGAEEAPDGAPGDVGSGEDEDEDEDVAVEASARAGGASEDADDEEEPRAPALPRRRGRQASAERLYIVTYDIASQTRWRRVFRTMKGYGRWLQLSVFQCRLTGRRRAEMGAALERLIHHHDDHVIILDLGPAEQIDPRVESMGKSFSPIVREAIIV